MKNTKYIITLFFFFISISSFSQETLKQIENALQDHFKDNPNTYYMDLDGKLQACVGTWIYNNGIDYFKAVISKKKVLVNEKHNVYSDELLIKYEYKKNGVCKYYNINTFNVPDGANSQPSDIKSTFVKNNTIFFLYEEPSFTSCQRRKTGSLDLQLITGTTNQLQWTRTTDDHYFNSTPCSDGTPIDNSDFIIPANMVLIKQ